MWDGKVPRVIGELPAQAQAPGPPVETNAAGSPRRVLANDVAHSTTREGHMGHPEYRRRGWPIDSGETEAAVYHFNERVKGTERFWSTDGVGAIPGLLALWLSQDDRWSRYWENRSAYVNREGAPAAAHD